MSIDLLNSKPNQYKFYRERAGLTQAEAAARLGKFAPGRYALRSSIAQWETGHASPDITMLLPLSEVYGCTVDELLRNSGGEKRGDD